MMRPDLVIEPLRGNVNTRLAKLEAGEYDAIILAAAGLERLGLQQHIRQQFATDRATTNGSLSGGLRLKQLNLSGSARYDEVRTTEEDSTGIVFPTETVRRMDSAPGELQAWMAERGIEIDTVEMVLLLER